MKKLIALLTAALTLLTMSTAVLAATDKNSGQPAATITFDSDKVFDFLHTFGNASDTGFAMELTEKDALSGKSLKCSESFKQSVSNRYGGFYIDAEDFGLDSFAGYTMELYISSDKAASKKATQFELFTDGDTWVSVPFNTDGVGIYRKASITVPASVKNTKIGLSFPIVDPFDGGLCMVDELKIIDNYGKTISNVGDIDNSLYKGPSGFKTVITIVMFILVLGAVGFGIYMFLKKVIWKYR